MGNWETVKVRLPPLPLLAVRASSSLTDPEVQKVDNAIHPQDNWIPPGRYFIYDSYSVPLYRFMGIIYSYFEKGCRKKCARQSRKALWVVLSLLFFKEI